MRYGAELEAVLSRGRALTSEMIEEDEDACELCDGRGVDSTGLYPCTACQRRERAAEVVQ